MSPKKIIRNGIFQRIVRNYYPHHSHYDYANSFLFYGHLRQIILSNDVVLIKRRSTLFRKLFEYQQLMIHTVHSSYQIAIKKNQDHHQITIPLAAFPNGIFVNNDDARRFYQWLKLTLK